MKEIGKKFQKFGRTALSTITNDIATTSKDSLPESKPQIAPSPTDDIKLLDLNDCKLYIYSQQSAGMNLYRMLNYVKPASIILQLRPDDVNPLIKSSEVGPEEVIPSGLHFKDCESALKNSGFFGFVIRVLFRHIPKRVLPFHTFF